MLLKYLIGLIYTCCWLKEEPEYQAYHMQGSAQGTTYHITYFSTSSLVSAEEVDMVFSELDSSLSLYKSYSLINKFNNSDKGIKVDSHLTRVVQMSLHVFKDTKGEFEITVKPLVQAWGFGAVKSQIKVDSAGIENILKCVGSSKLSFRKDSLLKQVPCVEIDLNGIAQGYTVDFLGGYLSQKGITDYMVEVGGEVVVKGINRVSNLPFKIGIETPDDHANLPLKKIVFLQSGALTTSGNYRKYRYSEGRKISHLINPKTGFSVDNEMISVTVWAKDAIIADAYDNAFMGMGLKKTLEYLKKRKDMGAYMIYWKPDGSIADTSTIAFPKLNLAIK
jgi:thiamine biosynthesis lipoprotein